MIAHGLPILTVLGLWWASTGLILYLDSLEKRTFGYSMLAATVLAGLALMGVAGTATVATSAAAYAGFACGLALWGWQLLAFYTGFLAGPRRKACETGSNVFVRFGHGLNTCLYHEAAVAAGGAAVLILTAGQPNRVALWTYLLLWGMHESAKLNLFFGVPNLGAEMLPDHLAYLASYMRRRPMSLFFPISVGAATAIAILLHQYVARAAATPFEIASGSMLTALMALAILEHWFLVAPVNASALWAAFLRPRRRRSAATAITDPQSPQTRAAQETWAGKSTAPNSNYWMAQSVCGARRRLAPIAVGQLQDRLIATAGRLGWRRTPRRGDSRRTAERASP